MIYNDNAKISTKIMNQLIHFILVCRSISVQLQGYIYIYIYIDNPSKNQYVGKYRTLVVEIGRAHV